MEVFQTAAALIVRSMVVSAQSAGQQRLLFLQRAVAGGEEAGELARLRDENRRLNSELRMLKDRFGKAPARKRYTPMQRLQQHPHRLPSAFKTEPSRISQTKSPRCSEQSS